MTKINLGLSQKPDDSTDDEKKETTVAAHKDKAFKDEQAERSAEEERISIEEILASVGLDTMDDEPPQPPPPTMDWVFIQRVCAAQIILSLISLTCTTLTIILGGMLWYKFTATAWALYLLTTAYTGYCAGKRHCYANMVGYCIMNAFQTFLHWGSLAWLIYMIYYLDGKTVPKQVENDPTMDAILFLELGESLTLLGTILTGLFGMVACCKGFGRLFNAQDRKIMEEIAEQSIQQQNKECATDNQDPC